jgi:hypothetical protein
MGRDCLGGRAHGRSKVRRKGILALALVAMLAVGVGVAFAAKSYSTKIVFMGQSGTIDDLTLFGDLNSNKSKCLTARTVGLFKKTTSGDYKLVDVDLSSFNGAWAVRGDLTGQPDLAIKVKRATRNHRKIVCKPNTITLTGGSPMYPNIR